MQNSRRTGKLIWLLSGNFFSFAFLCYYFAAAADGNGKGKQKVLSKTQNAIFKRNENFEAARMWKCKIYINSSPRYHV